MGASYEFEPTFFGQAAGALVVLVMGRIPIFAKTNKKSRLSQRFGLGSLLR